jgi:cobalt-zinc-cadmium efflux system membrane fusion protein
MKLKYIFFVIIITAAFIGFQFNSNMPAAETGEEQGNHSVENFFSDIDDHRDHAGNEDHDHDMHDEHDELDADNQEGHDHEADIHEEDADMHDDHDGHHHDARADTDEGFIDLLSPAQAKEAGIITDIIQAGTISRQIKLTGEVFFNQDRIVHLVPRISGVVASVHKKLGDSVKQGALMAVIHSRELTDIKSEYLSAIERIANAKINFEREKSLWEKKIISERDYLESKQDYIETRIDLQSAERKLHAMGFSEKTIADLPNQPHETLFQYRLTAPSDGIIIEKHIVQGELVTTESPVFIIADTTSLWVDLQVYPKDLASVKAGQKVYVSAQEGSLTAEGFISFLSPIINQETRTAMARVELSDKNDKWRAGLFATAIVSLDQTNSRDTLVVPNSAIQTINGKPSLFIVTPKGYLPVAVATGQSNSTHVEIIDGVTAGQTYVSNGSFELKAKVVTSTLDGHAGHGH